MEFLKIWYILVNAIGHDSSYLKVLVGHSSNQFSLSIALQSDFKYVLSLFVIIGSCGFILMPLGKCFLSKINRKNFWINTSFWLLDHNVELVKKIKNPNEKPDGFINC